MSRTTPMQGQESRYAENQSRNSENPRHGERASGGRASHDEIAKRAYEIYEESGCQEGHCDENWLRAENELGASRDRRSAAL